MVPKVQHFLELTLFSVLRVFCHDHGSQDAKDASKETKVIHRSFKNTSERDRRVKTGEPVLNAIRQQNELRIPKADARS